MSVTLRKKPSADGSYSALYLDIYHNGKRNKEFLKNLKLVNTPRTPLERENNKKILSQAEQIKLNRALELEGNEYDITAKHKQNIDFIALYKNFLETYKKEDIRVHKAVYSKFNDFILSRSIKITTSKQISNEFCFDFKEYLEQQLNGYSPLSYLKRFKVFLSYCVRKKVFKESPCKGITIKHNQDIIKKNVLTIDEIKLLKDTETSNLEVKKAFLFALFTGLRFSDTKALRYKNIDLNNQTLTIIQEKTGEKLFQPLHPFAFELIGDKQDNEAKVFKLPTSEGTNKMLKQWVSKAGIDKKITFHCARHSFATNHIIFKSDIVTLSKLMGHNTIRYTQIYTQIAEDLKRQTINNLPNI
jgi:site-specific recombinase XerD